MAKDSVSALVSTMRNSGSARLPGRTATGSLVVIFRFCPSVSMEAGAKKVSARSLREKVLSREAFTSPGVISSPFENFTPSRILKVQVSLSWLFSQLSARQGTISPFSSNFTSVSPIPYRDTTQLKYCSVGSSVSAKLVTPMVSSCFSCAEEEETLPSDFSPFPLPHPVSRDAAILPANRVLHILFTHFFFIMLSLSFPVWGLKYHGYCLPAY